MADRRTATTAAVTVIVLPAAIDRTNAGVIGGQLRAACTARAIVVGDMTGTIWCDSRGMRELVSAHRRAREAGGELRVAGPRGPLLRAWELLGADQDLAIYPTLEAAAATGRKPVRGERRDHFLARSGRQAAAPRSRKRRPRLPWRLARRHH